jgi:hypothetical protein
MKISYSALLPEQANSNECQAKAAELTAYISEKIEFLTVHEAGHLFFARRAKCHLARPVGPFIYFENGEYKYNTIGVAVPEWQQKHALDYTKALLDVIGNSLAAGGMFLERFNDLPEKDWGDTDDYDRFNQYCSWARRRDILTQEGSFWTPTSTQWTEARNRVRKILTTLNDSEKADIENIKVEVRATAF